MFRVDLSELLSVLGDPPAQPFAVDWPAVESWLERSLPAPYKQIGSTFGPWYIGDWVWVEVPCGDQQWYPGYTNWLPTSTREVRIRAREHHADLPALHPKPGGLLAWGHTRRTDVLFWDTTASPDPDAWPVVVYAAGVGPLEDPWCHTGLTTVDFLGAVIAEGVRLTENRRLGPLPQVAQRTLYRADAVPWTPPVSRPPSAETVAARRRALTEGSGLTALRTLVPPPKAPQLGAGSWETLFGGLGTALPVEYFDLMTTYGGGVWRSDLRFPAPLDAGAQGLRAHAELAADGYRQLRTDFPDSYPLAVWPEPGGLLAFADSIDGDYLGWLTIGSPDEWPVVVWPRHDEQGPPLATGLVDTLLAVMRGQPVTDFATLDPDDDPLDFAKFTPWGAQDVELGG